MIDKSAYCPLFCVPSWDAFLIFGKRRNYMPDNKAISHSEIKKTTEPAKAFAP